MDRRSLIKRTGIAGVLAAGVAPAVHAQAAVRWRLASSFPKSLDTIFGSAEKFSQTVKALSGGKFEVSVHPAGELMPAFGVVDALEKDTIEMAQAAAYYFAGKDPIFSMSCAIPFGLTTLQMARIVEKFPMATLSEADRIHVLVEAKKLAFADRAAFIADPRQVRLPVQALLADDYIARRATMIRMDKALPADVPAGDLRRPVCLLVTQPQCRVRPQYRLDLLLRGGGHVNVSAPRAQGDGDVLRVGRRGTQQEHGVPRRLFHGLQQRVRTGLVEAIRILDRHKGIFAC